MFAHGESVTFLHPTTVTDEYHNTVTSWATPTLTAVEHWGVEPRPAGERTVDARNATISGYTLYYDGPLPVGFVVDPVDRVVVRGKTFEIDGDAAIDVSPYTGWQAGTVVQCKVVTG